MEKLVLRPGKNMELVICPECKASRVVTKGTYNPCTNCIYLALLGDKKNG